MKIRFKLLLFTFVLIFSLNGVFAQGICCYDGGSSNTIRWSFADTCYEGEIEVGDFNSNSRCDYDYLHKGCKIGNTCYATAFGKHIYDFPEVYSYFENNIGVDIRKYCTIVDFDSSCSGNYYNSNLITTTDENNNNNYNDGNQLNPNDYNPSNNSIAETQDMLFCSSVGEPFGLFATPSDCNSLTNDGKTYPCIYNPYLSGHLKVSSEQGSVLGIGVLEGGCVAKSQIKTCLDYKTINNCLGNPVGNDPSYTNSNLQSCKWVSINDYFTGFELDSGICISDAVLDDKNYNFGFYSNRLNLIKNPSFELGLKSWDTVGTLNEGENDAFDGFNTLTLNVGESIKQRITDLDFNVGYRSLLYVKQDSSFTVNDKIALKITEYYSASESETFTYYADISNLGVKEGIFKKVMFNEHIISKNTKFIDYELSTNKKVVIDALTFEIFDTDSLIVDNGIFKPVEVIDSRASNCELCFDNNQFNFCTEKKSDLMGDCSYMVEDLGQGYFPTVSSEQYLGKDENYFLNNWSSQSIVNAKLFCEMYINRDICEDPNNYVNSKFSILHPFSDGNLCKWNEIHGCYKDSDGSFGPDTISNGGVFLHYLLPSDLNVKGHSYSKFAFYSFAKDGQYSSDFAYACDLIPPQTYMYFTAKDVNGTEILITEDFPNKILGDIRIYLEINDLRTEACDYFNIPKNLLVDYVVNNNKTFFRFIPNSFVSEEMQIKDLVISQDGKLLLEDGFNDIILKVKDQSGNLGKVRSFTINGDFKGPEIISKDDLTKVIGPNSTLNFEITDKTEITSCNFKLNPLSSVVSNNGIKDDFYVSQGNFFNYSNKNGDVYGFKLPIFNTTENLNVYKLEISCTDLFAQENSEEFYLYTDFDTSFVMQDPMSFTSYEGDTGFFNDEKDVWAVSVERNLESCTFDFKSTDGSGELNIKKVGAGFNVESYSQDVIFYSNITGIIDFETTGVKEIGIVCQDDVGNKINKDFIYYYDNIKPELVGIELFSNSAQTKTVVEENGSYFVRRINKHSTALDTRLDVIIDGTKSWVSDKNLSMKYYINGSYTGILRTLNVGKVELNESTFTGRLSLTNFDNLWVYQGEKIDDLGLYAQKYELSFKDKAGNFNLAPFEFYFDDSNPSLIFGDTVFAYGNELFTKEVDPLFGIKFNAPDYRVFSCTLNVPHESGEYNKQFAFTNYLKFKLSEIIPGFKISARDIVNINFDCVDKYDYHITGSYKLYYDNTAPILDDVYFKKGNNVYLPNSGDNYVYGIVSDNLVFEFEDTNEKAYECSYKFTSNDYDCKNTLFNVTFPANQNLRLETGLINVLSESYNESVCFRDRAEFNRKLNNARETGDNVFETLIQVEAVCQDKVKFKTETKKFDYEVSYVSGSKFVDFDVNYDVNEVIFNVKSLTPFDKVIVSYDSQAKQEILKLTYEGVTGNGVHIYKGRKSLSALGYPEENILIWAVGFWGTGEIADRIATEVIIDNQIPLGLMRFPDADQNDTIYSSDFEIQIKAEDFGGSKLNKIDLFLNNQKIFSTLNQSQYLNGSLIIIEGKNYFSWDSNEYFGDLIFNGAQIGGDYEFKLRVYDGFGNLNETIKLIKVRDGVSVRILDSDSAVVDFGGFAWITKNKAPQIKFKASRDVEKCSIYPFEDKKWSEILSTSNLDQISKSVFGSDVLDNEFTFSLSEFDNFNLNQIEENSAEIGIKCVYDGKTYSFLRTLEYIDALPDYVLTSSEGFILNGGSYKTIIDVKSVGVNKYVTCEYSIDGETPKKLSDDVKTRFTKEVSFNSRPTGISKLVLECEDKLGTKGPKKEYQFIINKNLEVEIKDLKLTFNNKEFEPSLDDKIFVSEFRNLGLEFITNRKDISCAVEIEKSSGSFFRNVLYFVENLFSGQRKVPIKDEVNYVYNIENGLEFSSTGVNKLRVVCSGGVNFEKEYEVEYKSESSLDFNLIRLFS